MGKKGKVVESAPFQEPGSLGRGGVEERDGGNLNRHNVLGADYRRVDMGVEQVDFWNLNVEWHVVKNKDVSSKSSLLRQKFGGMKGQLPSTLFDNDVVGPTHRMAGAKGSTQVPPIVWRPINNIGRGLS